MTDWPDPRVAEVLSRLEDAPFSGEVWKHTLPGQPPEAANTRGARWNPPGVNAVYLALSEDTAAAEGRHLVSRQPVPVKNGRRIHRGPISIDRVLDLRGPGVLEAMGVRSDELGSNDVTACQTVGGTAAWLGLQAIIVPSARGPGANLVVFEQHLPPEFHIPFAQPVPFDE